MGDHLGITSDVTLGLFLLKHLHSVWNLMQPNRMPATALKYTNLVSLPLSKGLYQTPH
jgi:hypothetical protein